MEQNASFVSQALAFRRDTCKMGKRMTAFCGFPSNSIPDEGVVYEGDADGTVHFRFYFPNATTVAMAVGNQQLALTKGDDGVWSGTGRCAVGFQYALLYVDAQEVSTPYLPFAYSFSRPVNYIDVPPVDVQACPYAMRLNIDYGTVASDFFISSEGTPEKLLVYLPPSYRKEANATRRYPVLYLQHGISDNENGWVHHGKVNFVADNLLADGKMTDMIIVMGNGMLFTEDGVVNPFGFVDRLVKDIIPYVDANYRTNADRDHRAVAGLSMGSTQATCASMEHPDLFSAVGIFCGFLQPNWSNEIAKRDAYFTKFKENPQAYRDAMKLVFRAMGDLDSYLQLYVEDSKILDELGFKEDVRRMYPGAHTWQVWRMCATDFLPLLFRA